MLQKYPDLLQQEPWRWMYVFGYGSLFMSPNGPHQAVPMGQLARSKAIRSFAASYLFISTDAGKMPDRKTEVSKDRR